MNFFNSWAVIFTSIQSSSEMKSKINQYYVLNHSINSMLNCQYKLQMKKNLAEHVHRSLIKHDIVYSGCFFPEIKRFSVRWWTDSYRRYLGRSVSIFCSLSKEINFSFGNTLYMRARTMMLHTSILHEANSASWKVGRHGALQSFPSCIFRNEVYFFTFSFHCCRNSQPIEIDNYYIYFYWY